MRTLNIISCLYIAIYILYAAFLLDFASASINDNNNENNNNVPVDNNQPNDVPAQKFDEYIFSELHNLKMKLLNELKKFHSTRTNPDETNTGL
ncbi:hypothetical protein POCGH01_00109400 [Plasmodium ovale]|uniref:Uncharacterized protein n=2 Tax=Plasmodium ovale TaxID=36330 RepID=A0A1A8VNT6_PLAOA|nr:hypothetical protein POVCU2_0007750 [Plasmodium ovale curtisi]SBS80965.1 hypothetical protein POVCU2_0007760 [Plasmodium ovale curtisi]SBS99567.1 hypothetical protein POVCU1_053570 [Plasmodium ovale curtisi]SBT83299.1 hypothetical protein POCGH01_00109400 [Plasmodium ovale]